MKKLLLLLCLPSFLLLLAPALSCAEVTVAEVSVATDIKDHGPVGAADKFTITAPQKIWCYSKITGGADGQAIAHKWFHKDNLIASMPLKIKAGSYRTYSYKTISPEMKGLWRVEIIDEAGKVLKTVNFTVE